MLSVNMKVNTALLPVDVNLDRFVIFNVFIIDDNLGHSMHVVVMHNDHHMQQSTRGKSGHKSK